MTFRSYRDRQDSRYSGIEEPAVLAHDGGERRRRPGEFDGGIAGIATNGEWQIELQNPTAGANRGRTGPAGYSLPAPPVAHASGVAPPIPPPTGPEPRWPGANNNANSIDDFPGLSGKKGGTSQSAMLGNWGKAAGAKSVRPEVIKPKSNPKDRNIHAPKPASAAPNSTKPATIQSNSIATPALKRGELPEPVAAKSLQSSEQSKEAQTKSIEKALEKNSISEPNYLSNIAYDISDSRSIINNMGSVDEYPRLSKPAAPVTSTNFQDKNAYPALPMPSGTGKEKNKKNAVESHVDHASILKKSSSISASISNPSTANLVATAAGFEPIQAKPHPKPFKNTVGDADEYPALPAKKKKSTKGGVNIPTTTDDSAVAFRSIRASVLGTKSPASTVSPAAAGAIFGSEHPQHAMESQSDYDYPPLFTPFRIGVPLSTNPTGIGKGKNSGKVSAKKQQKADLRMLAFNMK